VLPRVSDTLDSSSLGCLNMIEKSTGCCGRPTRGFNHRCSLLEITVVLVSFEICHCSRPVIQYKRPVIQFKRLVIHSLVILSARLIFQLYDLSYTLKDQSSTFSTSLNTLPLIFHSPLCNHIHNSMGDGGMSKLEGEPELLTFMHAGTLRMKIDEYRQVKKVNTVLNIINNK